MAPLLRRTMLALAAWTIAGIPAFASVPSLDWSAAGEALGVHASAAALIFDRFEPLTGATTPQALFGQDAQRVSDYLGRVPAGDPATFHARSLQAFLPREAPLAAQAFVQSPSGLALTPLGRNLLIDILTSRDGAAYRPAPAPRQPSQALSAGVRLSGFDWDAFQKLDRGEALERYAADESRQTVRLLVDASGADSPAALTPSAMDAFGASFVRSIDNIEVVEVPMDQAAGLARALEKRGLESRPALAFRAAAAPPKKGGGSAGEAKPAPRFGILNAESRDMLGVASLWKAGMTGEGATVGVIDTGIDVQHPDFKDRVVQYVDLTGEGPKDVIGHGTHVVGSIAGSGAASGGLYAGMAPKAKVVVFKVFDKNGGTTEDVILEAMRRAAELGVQVLNMSLGGPDDPVNGALSQMANKLVVENNVLVVAAAGNAGPRPGSVSSPGNAEYVLGVGGVDKHDDFPFFSSRGPVSTADGRTYDKPDLTAVSGGVDVPPPTNLVADSSASARAGLAAASAPLDCMYGPGVISARSGDDPDSSCAVPGNPSYRYMSGTSMAAPMASGIAADVAGWLVRNGAAYRATEVKAAMMETASDLGQRPEVQGAGLINGARLAQAVTERASLGLPVGNVAYMLSVRLTTDERKRLSLQDRYQLTSVGLWDKAEGRLVNDDAALHRVASELDALKPPVMASVDTVSGTIPRKDS